MSDHLHAWLTEDCGINPNVIETLRTEYGFGWKAEHVLALHLILGPEALPYIQAAWRTVAKP